MYKCRLLFCLMLCLALMLSLSACAEGLSIVCTNFPCYDFARAVNGSDANIRMLIKPGAEVHSFEPAPSDILAIAECDLFIYIGGESDAWVVDILESFDGEGPAVLRLFDCVEALELIHEDNHHHEGEYDEHIWTSPVNASRMVGEIAACMSDLDGSNAERYAANAGAYIGMIDQIDASMRAMVENAARTELVFADRFPFLYLAREYGLDYVSAFPSCVAKSEPSAKTMAMLIEKVALDEIPVIYTIELSNGKTAQTIAEETGAEICTLHSVQTLSDADFAAGESYVSLMTQNLTALGKGLN